MSPSRKKPVRGVQLRLNRHEAVILFAAVRLLAEMSDSVPEETAPKASVMEKLMAKLREALADTALESGERLAAALIDGIVPDVHITDLVDTDFSAPMYDVRERLPVIEQALRQHRTIAMTYFSLRQETYTSRQVDPYYLGTQSGQSLLIGYCHLRQTVRVFRVDRIKTVALADGTFTIPEAFNPEVFLSDSLSS